MYVFVSVAQLKILVFLPLTLFFPSTSDLDDLFEEISSIFLFNLRLPDVPPLEDILSNFLMVLPDEVSFEEIFSDLLLQSFFDPDL